MPFWGVARDVAQKIVGFLGGLTILYSAPRGRRHGPCSTGHYSETSRNFSNNKTSNYTRSNNWWGNDTENRYDKKWGNRDNQNR
jgi:hypothetical protein